MTIKFGELIWKIEGYNGTDIILEQTIPLNNADETKICGLLKSLASKHLNEGEIAAGLADVRKDNVAGNRIIFYAGQDPHYVASLWRSDELTDR
jgi:hypothetical protein